MTLKELWMANSDWDRETIVNVKIKGNIVMTALFPYVVWKYHDYKVICFTHDTVHLEENEDV